MYAALGIILACIVGALSLAQVYARRYRLQRPPIGVINLWDVALMLIGIVLVPYLYLALPLWLVVALMALAFMSILSFTLEPIFNARWRVWLITLALLAADIGSAAQFGTTSAIFFAINNLVLIVVVVGVT